jgi:hypothetical protein
MCGMRFFFNFLFDPPQDATNLRGEKYKTKKFDHHEPERNGRNQTPWAPSA